MKKFVITFLVLLLFLLSGTLLSAAAVNAGFEMEELPEDRQAEILANNPIRLISSEPEKDSIECFDVSESGLIAVGFSSESEFRTVCVYDSEGVFQYGYKFLEYGSFGVEWDGDNLFLYFVRGDLAFSVNADGEVERVLEITNTPENNYYWYDLDSTKRIVGDRVYRIRNKMGPLNLVATSYSQIVITQNGEETIIYDVNSQQLSKTLFWTILIAFFVGFAIVVFAYQIKELIKKQAVTANTQK